MISFLAHKTRCLASLALAAILVASIIPATVAKAQSLPDNGDETVVILVDLARISTQLHLAQTDYLSGDTQNAFDHAFVPRTSTFPSLKPILNKTNSEASSQVESLLTEIPLKIKSGAPSQDITKDVATFDSIAGNVTTGLGYAASDKNTESKVIVFLLRDGIDLYQLSVTGKNVVDYQSSLGFVDAAKSHYLILSKSEGNSNDNSSILASFSALEAAITSKSPVLDVSQMERSVELNLAQSFAMGSNDAARQSYFANIRSDLASTLGQVKNSDYTAAEQSVNSAYLDNFEYLETPLESHNATLKLTIEKEMRIDLRNDISAHGSLDQISSLVGTILEQLGSAEQLLKNDTSASPSANQTVEFADIQSLKEGFGSYSGIRKEIGQVDQNSKSSVMTNIDQIRSQLDQMLHQYQTGDPQGALQLSRSAYLDSYENIEVPLRPIDPDFTLDMEIKFAELRNLIQSNSPLSAIESKVTEIKKGLDESERLVTGPGVLAPTIAYSSSFAIIFREGLESALIIGAILTYLEASRNAKFKNQVYYGIIIAVAATGVTWYAAQFVIDISGASRDMIEAIASVSAVGVLFWVSFWILNKVETKRWIEFVKAKVWKATATGSMSVFVMLSFFTVYREGFETVLFYQALLSFAQYMEIYVYAGLFSGLGVIVFATFLVRKLGKKLPLRVLFGLTMGIGAYMSIAFIGNAVREFQDVGYVSTTSLIGTIPRFDINTATMTGIHPTLETVLSQIVLLSVYVAGSVYVLVIQPRRKKLVELSRKSRADAVDGAGTGRKSELDVE